MDSQKILEIVNDVKNKPNSDLAWSRDVLLTEFEKTKALIVDLTRHMETIEEYYTIIYNEIGKRLI